MYLKALLKEDWIIHVLKGFLVSELLSTTEFPISSIAYLDPTLNSSGKTFTRVSTTY